MNSLTKTLATMLAFLWIGRLLAQSDGDHTRSHLKKVGAREWMRMRVGQSLGS